MPPEQNNIPPQQNPSPQPQPQPMQPKSSGGQGVWFWIVGIVVVIAVIALIWWATSRPTVQAPVTSDEVTLPNNDASSAIINDVNDIQINDLNSEFAPIDQELQQL